jgi:hypothetical protein
LLTGILFDVIGARMTFLFYACLGFMTTVVYALLYHFVFGAESPPGTVFSVEVYMEPGEDFL